MVRENEDNNVLITGTSDADSIVNSGSDVTINALGGNDTVFNTPYGNSVSISAGADNDSIKSYGNAVTISAGAGDDTIRIYNPTTTDFALIEDPKLDYRVTIDAGEGDDRIYNWDCRATIDAGTGNDSIYTNGNCVDALKIYGGEGNDTILNYIGSIDALINAGTGDDYIVNNFGNDWSIIDAGAGNDTIRNNGYDDSIYGGDGNDDIYNAGWGERASISAGAGDDTIRTRSDGVTVDGGDGNDFIDNAGYSDDDVDIYDDYGVLLDEDYPYDGDKVSINGGAGDDTIYTDMGSNVSINGGADNDIISLGADAANNVILYYTGEGNDVIQGFNATTTLQIDDGTGTYSKETVDNDIIVTVGEGKITLAGAASITGINIYGEQVAPPEPPAAPKTETFDNDAASKVTLAADTEIGDASSRTTAIRITGNALDNTILGGTGKDSLYGGNGDDYLAGGAGNDKLYGQNGNDYMEGGSGNDYLNGSNGNDSLNGGAGNDTLTGGDGDDLFVYTAGKDVITDYEDGDRISLGAAISQSSVNGSDATFTIGSSTLTVKDGFGKEIVFVDADGNERTIIGGAYLSTDATASKVTLNSGVEVGDATARTKTIRLTGNALDNSIFGGSGKDSLYGKDGNDYLSGNAGDDYLSGGNGNDTLWGGVGNDTLAGSSGADVFLYRSDEGKDVISGFDNSDMLLITGAFKATVNTADKSIAFKVDSTADAVTIKNYTATSLNINGFKYKIRGTKLVK